MVGLYRLWTSWLLTGCTRGMLHDPELYPEPDVFRPERFVAIDGGVIENDPRDIAFGFGRRYDGSWKLVDTLTDLMQDLSRDQGCRRNSVRGRRVNSRSPQRGDSQGKRGSCGSCGITNEQCSEVRPLVCDNSCV